MTRYLMASPATFRPRRKLLPLSPLPYPSLSFHLPIPHHLSPPKPSVPCPPSMFLPPFLLSPIQSVHQPSPIHSTSPFLGYSPLPILLPISLASFLSPSPMPSRLHTVTTRHHPPPFNVYSCYSLAARSSCLPMLLSSFFASHLSPFLRSLSFPPCLLR